MRHTLVIAAREVREWTFILVVAAVVSVAPFIILNLRSSSRTAGSMEYIGAVGSVGAAMFTLAIAIILGATVVGRDLSERRLSFYFARPIGGAAIWFGKVIGALTVIAVSFALIFVPSWIAGRATWDRALNASAEVVVSATLAIAVFLLLASHVVSTIARSRSAVAGLDLAGIVAFVGAVLFMGSLLIDGLAFNLLRIAALSLFAIVVSIMIIAGAWQLSRGRTDVRRGHLEMSKFIWTALGVVILAGGAYAAWLVSAEPDDLTSRELYQSGRGDWAVVSGTSKARGDYQSAFLTRVATGDFVRIPAFGWYGPEFTRKGDAAFTMSSPRENRGLIVYRLDRDREPLRTGIVPEGAVVLSDDLSRAGVIGRTVSIHDLDGHRLLASARVPGSLAGAKGFFVAPGVLRTFHRRSEGNGDTTLVIHELDGETRRLTQTGSWTTKGETLMFRASADGSSLLVNGRGENAGRGLVLLDGRTGAVRARLEGGTNVWQTAFLADGRIAALTPAPDRSLRIFARDGSVVRDIPLGAAPSGRIVGEDAKGRAIVALYTGAAPAEWGRNWQLVVVDIDGGNVIRRANNLAPMSSQWNDDPRPAVPNATGEFVVRDDGGALWRWNVETGEKVSL